MRMPASAASIDPSAQLSAEHAVRVAPLSAARSRLSTTARIATPILVRKSRMRSPTATTMAAPNTMKLCHGIWMEPTLVLWPSKNSGNLACTVSGGQITVASWMRATSSPTDTTILVIVDASCRRRMMTRSMNTPSTGAKTNSTSTRASGAGRFHASGDRSCQ